VSSLWVCPADHQQLANAGSALFLVGGYDGSGNYGDVLQLATAIETVKRLPGSPLPVAIVESETREHHNELTRRYAEHFEEAAFAFFQDHSDVPEGGLVEPEMPKGEPPKAALYIYGGGHLNGWWGARKTAHATAAQHLLGGPPLPVVASGLQVDETAIAPDGPAHDLLSRASWIGVRDIDSLGYLRRQIPVVAGRVELAGDDALPFLEEQAVESAAVVNLHVNDGEWVSDEPKGTRDKIVALMKELATASSEQLQLQLQPVIAYEDPRVSERSVVADLLEGEGAQLEEVGLRAMEPLDILDDAIGNDLSQFRRARLTVSCSYHVTLTSLLAGIPAVMLAQNDYYEQKAAGLRDLFQLGPGRVGISGTPEDAHDAVEALVDGPTRTELVSHLRTQSRQVAERFERGRVALSVALAESLEVSGLESQLATMRQRTEEAERELAAVHATRGWRFLNVLRAARDMMR
jgi:Polysaccharide pyruvyl transferase